MPIKVPHIHTYIHSTETISATQKRHGGKYTMAVPWCQHDTVISTRQVWLVSLRWPFTQSPPPSLTGHVASPSRGRLALEGFYANSHSTCFLCREESLLLQIWQKRPLPSRVGNANSCWGHNGFSPPPSNGCRPWDHLSEPASGSPPKRKQLQFGGMKVRQPNPFICYLRKGVKSHVRTPLEDYPDHFD